MVNSKEERRGIQIVATSYILNLEEKKTFIHIIEGLKTLQGI